MKRSKLVLSAIGAGLVMWVVAGLWHNLILPGLYSHRHAAHDGIGMLLLAYLLLGGFMAGIYGRLRPLRVNFLWNGVIWGAMIGVLWVLPHGLAMVGAHGESWLYVLKNTAWHAVEQGIGGITIALILRNKDVGQTCA